MEIALTQLFSRRINEHPFFTLFSNRNSVLERCASGFILFARDCQASYSSIGERMREGVKAVEATRMHVRRISPILIPRQQHDYFLSVWTQNGTRVAIAAVGHEIFIWS